MKVKVDIDLSYVTRALSRLKDGTQRMESFLDEVGDATLKEFGRVMDTEGLGQWPKLDSRTLKAKTRVGAGGAKILYRTGAMRESFTRKGAPGNVYERGPLTLDVGSRIPYAFHHQQGNALHPARPIVFMTTNLEAQIKAIAARYLEALIDG